MSTTVDASLKFNHTCLRVRDPAVSVPFYEKHFGMKLIHKLDIPAGKFTNYFLAMDNEGVSPGLGKPWADREGVLELTHNWGTESDPEFKGYNNGNKDPYRGFGHICFTVDNIDLSCNQLELEGVSFQKKLSDGRQRNIAFALDPDGYWVELVEHGINKAEATTNVASNILNHTMTRVKDPVLSLKFYKEVLGMKLYHISKHDNAKFTLYFLGYDHDPNYSYGDGEMPKSELNKRPAVLELTHNWGTESDPEFKGYHNGNSEPQGYGHIGLSVADAEGFCAKLESQYGDSLKWRLKMNLGMMKNILFLLDPDGYSVEIIPSSF